jgi:hypothetical protein
MQVDPDSVNYEARATPNGQLAFFAEFLKISGVCGKRVERMVCKCPSRTL